MNSNPDWIKYDGTLHRSGTPLLTAASRAFRYADGLFETMLLQNGRIRLEQYHFDRLFAGLQFLGFVIPPAFHRDGLREQILDLCRENGNSTLSRIRLVVFRGEGGIFDPADDLPHYIIESWPLPAGATGFNHKGLIIDVFPDGRKACDPLANLKSNNYLLYALAARYARKHGLDDSLVLNSRERLADSAIANLFYARNGKFYTPPLSEGGVAGTMRRHLLENMPAAGFSIEEKPVTIEDLLGADEVFLTNALKGIHWVASFRASRYTHQLTSEVHKQLFRGL